MNNKTQSRFEDDPIFEKLQPCLNREHYPPTHLVIPQGKIYIHVCPNCQRETVIRPLLITN